MEIIININATFYLVCFSGKSNAAPPTVIYVNYDSARESMNLRRRRCEAATIDGAVRNDCEKALVLKILYFHY